MKNSLTWHMGSKETSRTQEQRVRINISNQLRRCCFKLCKFTLKKYKRILEKLEYTEQNWLICDELKFMDLSNKTLIPKMSYNIQDKECVLDQI